MAGKKRKRGKNREKNKKKLSLRNTALRTVLFVIISLVLGVSIYRWNAKSLMGNELPMPFGYGISVVLSGSMEPVLSVDDLVFIRKTQDVEVGDIIVYQSGHQLIIHRVIETDGDTFLTKGDANNVADEPVNRSSVKGVMVGSIPFIGKIVRVLKMPAGSIGVLAAAFVLAELSYRREQRQDDEELEQMKEEIRRLKNELTDEQR